MFKPLSRALALTLAACLPLAAAAAPVTVTTYSAGTAAFVDDAIMNVLGAPNFPTGENTYELTLQSTFDLDVNSYTGDSTRMYVRDAEIMLTLKVGTFTFEKTGIGFTDLFTAGASTDTYLHYASFHEPFSNLTLSFTTSYLGAPGSAGGHILQPRELAANGAGIGGMAIGASINNPEATDSWSMFGEANRSMVSVVSSVPEPAEWAMLAAGIAVIAARRRRTVA